MKLYEHLKVCL